MTIDSYLDALRSSLAGRMPGSIADQRLRELETHLWMSAADHRNQGQRGHVNKYCMELY